MVIAFLTFANARKNHHDPSENHFSREKVQKSRSYPEGVCIFVSCHEHLNRCLPFLQILRLQHRSIARLASAQMLDGIVHIAHRESLSLRSDVVACTEI